MYSYFYDITSYAHKWCQLITIRHAAASGSFIIQKHCIGTNNAPLVHQVSLSGTPCTQWHLLCMEFLQAIIKWHTFSLGDTSCTCHFFKVSLSATLSLGGSSYARYFSRCHYGVLGAIEWYLVHSWDIQIMTLLVMMQCFFRYSISNSKIIFKECHHNLEWRRFQEC